MHDNRKLFVVVPAVFGAFLICAVFLIKDEPAQESVSDIAISHRASLMEKDFYEGAFRKAKPVSCPDAVSGAVVNHHLLADTIIAETFSCIDSDTPLVVLISPNHFSTGKAQALTAADGWLTPYGDLIPDTTLIGRLTESGVLETDEEAFDGEHGIGNLVAFVKRAAPDASFLPIILKDTIDSGRIQALADALSETLPEGAVVIGSFDFSHDLTGVAARHADHRSLAILESLDRDRIRPLDIDSIPGIDLLFALMQARGTARFTPLGFSDASEIIGGDIDAVTGYITGVYSDGRPQGDAETSLLVVGDVMLSRGVEDMIAQRGFLHLIEPIRRLFWGSDAVIGQLEGAVSDTEEDSEAFPPRFLIDARILSDVRRAGFTHFSLSTNHTADDDIEGVERTRVALEAQDIGHFGGHDNETGREAIIARGGMQVGLIGYDAFGDGAVEVALNEIARLKHEVDRIVVIAHWGVEGLAKPVEHQETNAHAFIDAGADIVLGSHPHVIQPLEVYKDTPIFYSLGNFLFDQDAEAAREGLAVGIRFTDKELFVSVIPVFSDPGGISLGSAERRGKILKEIGLPSGELTLTRNSYAE